MRILVLGGSGLLGRQVLKDLGGVGTYFSRPFPGGIQLKSLQPVFDAVKPTVCVNCVVERTVDTCENNWNMTKKINIDFVDELATICARENIHLVHISTDYVFDGRNPPYKVDSLPNPLQNYGVSKIVSEMRVQSVPKRTIIRVPVLYGNGQLGDSDVTLIGHKVLDRTRQHAEDDVFPRRPVFVSDLSAFIKDVVISQKFGTLHFANPGPPVTKFQMAQIIGKYLRVPIEHIVPLSAERTAARPYDTHLIGYHEPATPLEKGLEECFANLYHPPLEDDPQSIFIVVDLDGTLVDSEQIHFECYRKVKPDFEWTDITPELRDAKFKELIERRDLAFMPGAENFIKSIKKNGIAHCIVTNTDKRTVDFFKTQLPLLNSLENWITRDDYANPKPDGEPYLLALAKYGQGKKYIIGFENSDVGYKSLCSITRCIYIIGPDRVGEDVYRISSFEQIT